MQTKTDITDIYQNAWIPIIGIPIVAALMPLIFFNQQLDDGVSFWYLYAHSLLFTTGIWVVNLLAVKYLNKRYRQPEDQKKRTIWLVILSVVLTTLVSRLISYLLPLVDPHFNEICNANQRSLQIGTYVMLTMVMLLYESKRNALLYKQVLLEKAELEKAQSVHILESLKNQVNPHFLFNSLNTLVSLIREDGAKAEEFTRRLSSVYRAILDCQHEHICPLEHELQLAGHYAWLLQARFGDHLQVHLDCADHYANNRFLPPLTLQLLIENAVKHNIASAQKPLRISVGCDDKQIWVQNNLQPKLQDTTGAGIGLENLRARFGHLTEHRMEILETETTFTVKLPLLTIQELAA